MLEFANSVSFPAHRSELDPSLQLSSQEHSQVNCGEMNVLEKSSGDFAETKSFLYVGKIQHSRLRPAKHHFQYGLFMAFVDLDEVDQQFNNWFCSTSRWSPVQLRRADYFGDCNLPIAQCVRERVSQELGIAVDGPIRMLTNLRYFGFVFNPVTFYFCYDNAGRKLTAVLADVTNTPWGERHAYVIPMSSDGTVSEHHCEKAFHVSPFMSMDQAYWWRISRPGKHLRIAIENHDQLGKLFVAHLNLKQRPFTKWRLAGLLAAFPWVTAKVFVAIYWQAFRLWWKRVPFVPHPKSTSQPTNS